RCKSTKHSFIQLSKYKIYIKVIEKMTFDTHIMIYIFNCTIGAFTPPMGTLMFVTCGITKCRTKDFIREAIPFYILFAVDIIVLTYIPQLTTFLVDIFY
ncbi:MAG: hypothetical protein PWP24_1617, partial [Clostridiales bacterium]|nr:hypothetical protein [Clostridiales bacterium]